MENGFGFIDNVDYKENGVYSKKPPDTPRQYSYILEPVIYTIPERDSVGVCVELEDTSKPKRRSYSVEIEEEHCKGCLICVYICDKLGGKILKASEEKTALGGALPEAEDGCIGCRWCERFCPDFAITVEETIVC